MSSEMIGSMMSTEAMKAPTRIGIVSTTKAGHRGGSGGRGGGQSNDVDAIANGMEGVLHCGARVAVGRLNRGNDNARTREEKEGWVNDRRRRLNAGDAFTATDVIRRDTDGEARSRE